MASDVAQTKNMALPRVGIWKRHVAARTCWRVCIRVSTHLSAQICTRVKREIKLLFQDNVISLCHMHLIYVSIVHNFCHVGLCFVLKRVQVTWHYEER